jgi:hypothetical protein
LSFLSSLPRTTGSVALGSTGKVWGSSALSSRRPVVGGLGDRVLGILGRVRIALQRGPKRGNLYSDCSEDFLLIDVFDDKFVDDELEAEP